MVIKSFLLSVMLLLWTTSAFATIRYVDKDDGACTDAGSGASSAPFCTINAAVTYSSLAAGDHIKIRGDGSTAYTGNTTTPTNRNGTSPNPIVVEPDDGATPNLLATINLANVDYWTVQNLRWDACSVTDTSARSAITIEASLRTVTGNKILNNTINCWGGTDYSNGGAGKGNTGQEYAAIYIRAYRGDGYWATSSTISGNIISEPIESGMWVIGADASEISGNTISGVRCGIEDTAPHGTGIYISGGTAPYYSQNVTISGNTIFDFQDENSCRTALSKVSNSLALNGGGIYCDAGTESATLDANIIHGIPWDNYGSAQSRGSGIFWESRCSNSTIKNNVIYDIQSSTGTGIQLASTACDASIGNKIYNNTVYNITGGPAIELYYYSQDTDIKNNIAVAGGNGAGISVAPESVSCGGNTINYNDYYRVGGGAVTYSWNGSSVTSFATWKSNCNCDANSITSNPLFVNAGTDFHLQQGSPARGAGEKGVDMGALQYQGGAVVPRIHVVTY